MSVHILKEGCTLCRTLSLLDTVPGGPNSWVSFQDKTSLPMVDCWRCICVHLGKPIPEQPKSPEHDKVKESGDLPQRLCEFVLEFLAEKRIQLAETHEHQDDCYTGEGRDRFKVCDRHTNELLRSRRNVVDLAAEFAGIDSKAYSAEKDAALKYVRDLYALEHWATTEGRAMLSTLAQP